MPHTEIYLGVNIDHVATLRQARGTLYPEPLQAALMCEHAGADGITVHLREDRRHIQDRDVEILQELLQTRLNLEMSISDKIVTFAERLKPPHVCLVPEKREELTTEGGLDVLSQQKTVQSAVERLLAGGAEVSLFIDPIYSQIEAALATGAQAIELHTGEYADAKTDEERRSQLNRLTEAAKFAADLGLIVNAGHGLHYHNVKEIAAIPQMNELNIGHAIIARALFSGLDTAVRDMKRLMLEARM